jgi:hypothetical protein
MTIVLGLVIAALFGIIVFQQNQIAKLTDKVMSRDYTDYARARILETQVKAELDAIKTHTAEEDFR